MRHLWSLLAGVVAAPLTWILIAAGQSGSDHTISGWMSAGSYNPANLIESTVYLAVAGILLGVIGTLRFSPAGALVAGLLLVAPYVGMFVDPFAVRGAVPADWRLFDDDLPLRLPLDNGTLLLIGALLLMATFSVQRWRRWPAPSGSTTGVADAAANKEDPSPSAWLGTDPDVPEPTLGYPKAETLSSPLPRRESGSPWSTPPRTTAGDDQPAS